MSRKAIGIAVAVVVAIIAIVVAIIWLNGNKDPNTIENTPPTQEEIDYAKDLQKYMPDKTVDEIIEIGRTELTEEQQEDFDNVMKNYEVPEVAEIISTPEDQDSENEDPAIVYRDTDGNINKIDFTEEEWNMTDEEAEEEMRRMEAEMDQRMKDYAERWEKKQNGEPVDPITPSDSFNTSGSDINKNQTGPDNDNNEGQFNSNDSGSFDPYRGYGSYEAYLDAMCKNWPDKTREEVRSMYPDLNTATVDEENVNALKEQGRLTSG